MAWSQSSTERKQKTARKPSALLAKHNASLRKMGIRLIVMPE